MLLHLQTCCFPEPNNKQSSESENHCCSKRRKQGVGVYWQEKIIERRSTNEARMAALINVTLFARRSILNVIYLNESVCSRKLGIHPAGCLACRRVLPPSTASVSTSANTHPSETGRRDYTVTPVYLRRLINFNPPCSSFGTLSK